MRTFLRVLSAIGFIGAGVSVLMDLARGDVGFALLGGVGFVFGLLTFLLLNPNPARRPVRYRTATIVYHWIVLVFCILFGGGFLVLAASGAGAVESEVFFAFAETFLVLYALFLAFAIWVAWRTIRMLRSDRQAEMGSPTGTGAAPMPPGPGGIGP